MHVCSSVRARYCARHILANVIQHLKKKGKQCDKALQAVLGDIIYRIARALTKDEYKGGMADMRAQCKGAALCIHKHTRTDTYTL